MAKTKYKVKKGQSFASFEDPKAVMALNPGVASLSAGQTIWVPPQTGGKRPAGFGPKTNFTSANSFMSGGQVNVGSNFMSANSFMSGGQVSGNTQIGSSSPSFYAGQGVRLPTGPTTSVFQPGSLNSIGANSFYSGNQVNTEGQFVPNSVRQGGIPGTGTLNPSTSSGTTGDEAAPLTPDQWATKNADGTWGRAGAGNLDFAGTGFAQYNAENNISFNNQLRWDPSRGQYVKIGKLISEGRLDVRDKLARLKSKRRGGGGGGGGEPVTVIAPEVPITQGNMVNSALSWRVG